MEKPSRQPTELAKKRKRKSTTKVNVPEAKNKKLNNDTPVVKPKKETTKKKSAVTQQTTAPPTVTYVYEGLTTEEIIQKYPVLQDKELVAKFLKVSFNNNQRGRIKQAIKLQLESSNNRLNPDAIHGKIQAIIKHSNNLTDSELRRIRILYNMLNTALTKPKEDNDSESKTEKPKKNKKKSEKKKKEEITNGDPAEPEEEKKKEQLVTKVKGPKRYVVFVGNLPGDITKEMILDHFSEFQDKIKDVRIPKKSDDKKSAIAFIEVADEPTYELTLSKHHTMLSNKRIKVLYSTQKDSKITKAEAKSKSAKLIALQKSGKLLGSVPLEKKRSQRRLKMKKAQKQAAASA